MKCMFFSLSEWKLCIHVVEVSIINILCLCLVSCIILFLCDFCFPCHLCVSDSITLTTKIRWLLDCLNSIWITVLNVHSGCRVCGLTTIFCCLLYCHSVRPSTFDGFASFWLTDWPTDWLTCSSWSACVLGWKVDEVMMSIFQQCWPTMNKLHSIKYAPVNGVSYFTRHTAL